MYSSDELFQRSREGYFGVYFPSCEATREINTKITHEWAQKQFVTRVHTLSYFSHNITNPWMTIKMKIFTHRPRVSLIWFSFCWWRHNPDDITMTRQLWRDHVNSAISLDIDFIHSDIHGRLCKKLVISRTNILSIYYNIPPGRCHKTSLKINPNWLR